MLVASLATLCVVTLAWGQQKQQTASVQSGQQPSGGNQSGPPAGYQPPGDASQGYAPPPGAPGAHAPAKDEGRGYIRYSIKPGGASGDGRLYVIRRGDCLWDIAGNLYRDPWKWRDIWTQNRYIVNPDLIYPGRELRLGQYAGPVSGAPESSGIDKSLDFEEATEGFLEDTVPSVDQDSVELAQREQEELDHINDVLRRKILTSEFLASTPFLWMKPDARGLIYPGDARIDTRSPRTHFQQFDRVPIKIFGDEVYAVGDTLDVFRSERMLSYRKQRANLVRRIGRGVVVDIDGEMMHAELVDIWDVVKKGDRIAKVTAFPTYSILDYVEPQTSITGEVFERVEKTLFPYLFHSFILNRGSSDGVQVGDLFVAYTKTTDDNRVPAQVACAVHVDDTYATLTTVKLYRKALEEGDRVALVKRMKTDWEGLGR